jgi:hypothetical protein
MRLPSARACAIPALTRSADQISFELVRTRCGTLGETVHEVLDRTRETVELPDQDHIETPLASLTHELVKLGTPALGSTDSFVYELAAAPEPLAGIAPQII